MNPKTNMLSPSDAEAVWRQLQQRNERLAVMAVLVAARRRRLKLAWRNMLHRCYYAKTPRFDRYGGRGITAIPAWQDFNTFAQWALHHGFYTDLTLDRRDNDGNYTPENCRWVSMSDNLKNRKVSERFVAAARRGWKSCGAKVLAASVAKNSRPVINSNGVTYPSTAAAARALGFEETVVWKAIKRGTGRSGGLIWRYA